MLVNTIMGLQLAIGVNAALCLAAAVLVGVFLRLPKQQ